MPSIILKNNPRVSIITVVFNGEKYIEKTIQSVLNQTYNNIEYIIVDGGSTDGTIGIIEKYAANIRWITEPDKGIYDAMNKGISIASGDWLNFLNGDDYFFNNEVLSTVFNNDTLLPESSFVYGDSVNIAIGFQRYIKARALTKDSVRKGLGTCHQAMFVKRSIAPFYDINYKYKAEYNWVIDILNEIPQQSIIQLEIPIVYYVLGGFSEVGLMKNTGEFISITKRRFGWVQALKNFPVYVIIFLRHLKYKYIGYA